jgi:hypothetical protein
MIKIRMVSHLECVGLPRTGRPIGEEQLVLPLQKVFHAGQHDPLEDGLLASLRLEDLEKIKIYPQHRGH